MTMQQRAVRDLAWALFKPALFQPLNELPPECLQPIWQDNGVLPWLQALDKQPSALLNHLKEQRATRLGVYFEQLLSFFFAEYPRFTLLAKNLQAHDAKRTIGEYDFIVWDNDDQQHYHIEVAVKFYIGLQALENNIPKNTPIYNWHLWVGPNKKDTLAIKMNHLMQHQLRLAETQAGKEALKSIHLRPEQLRSKLLLSTCLYHPEHTDSDIPAVTPPHYSQDSNQQSSYTGTWVNKDQLQSQIHAKQQYIVLPRQLWMSALTRQDIIDFSLDVIASKDAENTIQEQMSTNDIPLHIAVMDHSSSFDIRRFFVIP